MDLTLSKSFFEDDLLIHLHVFWMNLNFKDASSQLYRRMCPSFRTSADLNVRNAKFSSFQFLHLYLTIWLYIEYLTSSWMSEGRGEVVGIVILQISITLYPYVYYPVSKKDASIGNLFALSCLLLTTVKTHLGLIEHSLNVLIPRLQYFFFFLFL